jgi:integrase
LAGVREREAKTGGDPDALAFVASNRSPLNLGNLRRRVLAPAASEACLWSGFGFHAFRHTCASLLLDEGRNVKQVQRWLGHHSAAFTLATYVHLLPDEIAAPLDLPGRSCEDQLVSLV